MPTLNLMATDPEQWPLLCQLIKSGQVPEPRMADLARDFPDFWSFCSGDSK